MSRTLKGPEEELSPTRQVSKISESVEVDLPTEAKNIQPVKLSIRNFDAWYGAKRALKGINLDVIENSITAFIGPSGCGKTTLIRCLNRMHEMTPGASAKG
ncbi:MAG: ATP-binding cassette domain-containing protein, partial [Nitrososphaeraceae archaeon]